MADGQSLQQVIPALVTAWRNLSAYPAGHPARAASLGAAHERLTAFMATSGPLALGVSKAGLSYGELKLESPHVRALAEALYRRNVALLRFAEGLEAGELEALLGGLAESRDPQRPELAQELTAAGAAHIGITVLDYAVLDTQAPIGRQERPRDLWSAILEALLTGKELSPEGGRALSGETYTAKDIAALFLATDAQDAEARSTETLSGVIASQLSTSKGGERSELLHQIAELVRSLPPAVRQRVVDSALKVLASDPEPESTDLLVKDLQPDEVLSALRRASAEGVRLSSHALRLVQTLSAAASQARAEASPTASLEPEEILGKLKSVYRDEDIDRYNPESHEALIEQAAAVDLASLGPLPAEPLDLGDRGDSLTERAIARALAATLVELLAVPGPEPLEHLLDRLQGLFAEALSKGRLDLAREQVDAIRNLALDVSLPRPRREELARFLVRLAASEQVMGMVGGMGRLEPAQVEQLRDLLTRMGAAAARSLLGALAAEQEQSRRRRLFDVLVSLGPSIVDEARKLLADPRWFVVRNMIALLRSVGDRSSLPEVRRCAESQDLRVRLEAIKTLLALDPSVPTDLLESAILDPDPKLAEAAIALTGQYGIQEAKEPLLRLLGGLDLLGARRSLRLKALRALADLGDPGVLPRLGRFFRDWRLPLVALEERRSAYKLLEAYPEAARRPYVDKGVGSRDAAIRQVCKRLLRSAPRAGAAGEEAGPTREAPRR